MTVAKDLGGRPLKFATVDELEKKVEAYFKECDREEDSRVFSHAVDKKVEWREINDAGVEITKSQIVCTQCGKKLNTKGCTVVSGALKLRKPYTVTGLAVWLDTSRRTLLDYE